MADSRSVRIVTDPAVLAALAHPTRRRLMDALRTSEAGTVGTLAAQLGIAAGNISHHLKVLHEVALVIEAPELARDRRERWWRLVDSAVRWSSTEFDDGPATEAIVAAATSMGLDRQVELARRWLARDDRESRAARAAFSTDTWLTLTGDELDQVAQEVQQVFFRWRERTKARSGSGESEEPSGGPRTQVFLFARGFPAQP